jgi:hypothetical protein
MSSAAGLTALPESCDCGAEKKKAPGSFDPGAFVARATQAGAGVTYMQVAFRPTERSPRVDPKKLTAPTPAKPVRVLVSTVAHAAGLPLWSLAFGPGHRALKKGLRVFRPGGLRCWRHSGEVPE